MSELREINIKSIDPSPFQTRDFSRPQEIDDLAASIKAVGVLEPVLVRKKGRRYELVAGERRLRASSVAGLKKIPSVLRELNDEEAMEATVTENLQRRDLHPLEEAEAIATLIEKGGWTQEEVASTLGRSLSFVARRARITKLAGCWIEAAADPKLEVRDWSARHFEVLATIEIEDQEQLFKDLSRYGGLKVNGRRDPHSSIDLERRVDDVVRKLHSALWKLDDEGLAGAPACSACPMRASANPGLFDDVAGNGDVPKNDRCLSGACWNRKLEAFIDRRKSEIKEEHGNAPILLSNGWSPENGIQADYNFEISKKPKKDHVPALYVSRGKIGHTVFVKRRSSGTPTETKGPKTMKEKREGLKRRRYKRAQEKIHEALVACELCPDVIHLVALAAYIGTKHRSESWSGSGAWWIDEADPQRWVSVRDPWKEMAKGDVDADVMILWKTQILPVLLRRTTYQPHGDIEAMYAELERIGALVDVDAAALLKEAIAEIPEPKSWKRAS